MPSFARSGMGGKPPTRHASTLRENSKQKTNATIAGKAFRSTRRRSQGIIRSAEEMGVDASVIRGESPVEMREQS